MDKTRIFETAGRFAAKGQLAKAAKEYERVLKQDPQDVRALQKLAEIHQKNGKLESASELLLKVAEGYSEQGFFLKAVAVYKQILKFGNEDRIDVNLKLAQLYQQLGLINDATQQHQAVANYYDKTGNVRESLAAVRRMVDLDPDNVASRVKLGELYAREQMTADAVAELKRAASYLKKNNRGEDHLRVTERVAQLVPDDASVAIELARVYLGNMDTKRALARLQVCFRQDPRDIETLQLLARAFTDLGQVDKTISVYRELVHVYAEAGQSDQHKQALEKLLELAPDDPEATDALRRLGGAVEPEVATVIIADDPEPVVVPPAAPKVEAKPPPTPAEPPTRAEPSAPAEPPAPAPSSRSERVRTGLGSALPPPAGTTPAVTKVLTEVDVYLKYGLVPKAEDHLRAALGEHSESIGLHEKLLAILDRREAPAEAEQVIATLVSLARSGNDTQREAAYLQELGQRNPDHQLVAEASAAADLGGVEDELDDGFDDLDDIIIVEPDETELRAAQLASDAATEDSVAIEVEHDEDIDVEFEVDTGIEDENEHVIEIDDSAGADDDANELDEPQFDSVDFELDDAADSASSTPDEVDFALDEDAGAVDDAKDSSVEEAVVFEEQPAAFAEDDNDVSSLDFGDDDFESAWGDEDQTEASSGLDAFTDDDFVQEPAGDDDAPHIELFSEELDEADFLIQQGLEDDARYALEDILAQAPDHSRALALLKSIQAPESTQPPESAPPLAAPARSDGFDLSAELADEFDSIERTPTGNQSSDPVSVGDVLGEFEMRAPETIAAEDSQTHYDLGIAYKEMGMLDEAIHEFEVALGGSGTRRFVDCLTMIGICHLEKGQPTEAIERLKEALKTPGLTLEGSKEAHFQIGVAREALDQPKEAFGHFARVYKADPAFRNVREKVLALRAHAKRSVASKSGKQAPVTSSGTSPASSRNEEPTTTSSGSNRGKIGFV